MFSITILIYTINLFPSYCFLSESTNANTQQPKEPLAKGKRELENSNNRPLKATEHKKLSLSQKLKLECAFHRTPYPSRTVRAQLACNLGLEYQTLMVSGPNALFETYICAQAGKTYYIRQFQQRQQSFSNKN